MTTEAYTSPERFEREQRRIFRRLWLFAGLRCMVARPSAYYARRLAGVPILLQNQGGVIACFLNACAHRGAMVQPEGHGTRPPVCGYHGWRYAADGAVDRIPSEERDYRFTPEERACLRLRRYALVEVGQFLFVNFDEAPLPIESQFPPEVLADLRAMSEHFDTDVATYTATARHNWKLAGENLRDPMHPQFVHPRSLHPVFDFFGRGDATHDPDDPPSLPAASFGGLEGHPKRDLRWPFWDQLDRWPAAAEGYHNWLLFPNLHIASPDGCRSFGVEQYDPVDAGTTRLFHFLFTARRREPIPHGHAILRGMVRSARVVLAEDARIMEMVQAGAVEGAPPPRFGWFEREVQYLGAVYREVMGE